jgi:hypothetical protein
LTIFSISEKTSLHFQHLSTRNHQVTIKFEISEHPKFIVSASLAIKPSKFSLFRLETRFLTNPRSRTTSLAFQSQLQIIDQPTRIAELSSSLLSPLQKKPKNSLNINQTFFISILTATSSFYDNHHFFPSNPPSRQNPSSLNPQNAASH